jgi:hypothetical protein
MENPNILRNEIHTSFNTGLFGSGIFDARIISLTTGYPISDSQNLHMYSHIIQELNRKYSDFGFNSKIETPIDAGFRPLNVQSFFTDSILLEDGYKLLTEDLFTLVLEQSN